jgi:hypothetical protein
MGSDNKNHPLSSKGAKIAWHYTTGRSLHCIQKDGVIKLEGQAGNYGYDEIFALSRRIIPQFAWFTTADEFPVSAIPAIQVAGVKYLRNLKMTSMVSNGLYRIGVDRTGLIQWKTHPWRLKNRKTSFLRRFEKAAFPDNPDDWWVSETPVLIAEAIIERVG